MDIQAKMELVCNLTTFRNTYFFSDVHCIMDLRKYKRAEKVYIHSICCNTLKNLLFTSVVICNFVQASQTSMDFYLKIINKSGRDAWVTAHCSSYSSTDLSGRNILHHNDQLYFRVHSETVHTQPKTEDYIQINLDEKIEQVIICPHRSDGGLVRIDDDTLNLQLEYLRDALNGRVLTIPPERKGSLWNTLISGIKSAFRASN